MLAIRKKNCNFAADSDGLMWTLTAQIATTNWSAQQFTVYKTVSFCSHIWTCVFVCVRINIPLNNVYGKLMNIHMYPYFSKNRCTGTLMLSFSIKIKTYNTMLNFWQVCMLIGKSTVLTIFIKWNIFYQPHYFNVFEAFSNRKTILLCIMLQNYLLIFMYGEGLYALQNKKHTFVNDKLRKFVRMWNKFQQSHMQWCLSAEILQQVWARCGCMYVMHGIKNIHTNWLSAQKHKSNQSWEEIIITVQK